MSDRPGIETDAATGTETSRPAKAPRQAPVKKAPGAAKQSPVKKAPVAKTPA